MHKYIFSLALLIFVSYLNICFCVDQISVPNLPLQRVYVYSDYTRSIYGFKTNMQSGSAYVFKLSRYSSSSSLNDVDQLSTLLAPFSSVERFRTDRFDKKIYFRQKNRVSRMNSDGSTQEGIYFSDQPLVGDFAIDDVNRNLFIMRESTNAINVELVRISLDTFQERVIKRDLVACSAMQVDPVNNLLYIVQSNVTAETYRKYLLVISSGGYELDKVPLYDANHNTYSCDEYTLAVNRNNGVVYIGNTYTLEYIDYVNEQRGVILYPSDWTNAFYSSSSFSDLFYEEKSNLLYMLRSSGEGMFIDVSGTPPRPTSMTVFFTIDTPLGFAVFPCEGDCDYAVSYDLTTTLTVLGFTTLPVGGLLTCMIIVCVKNRRERLALQVQQGGNDDDDSDDEDDNDDNIVAGDNNDENNNNVEADPAAPVN